MSSALTISRMSFGAANVGCVMYGLYVLLASICLYFLLGPGRKSGRPHIVMIVYTVTMFVTTTIYFVAAAAWSEIEFVETPLRSGVFAVQLSDRLAVLKDTTSVVNIWLADSLILYRVYVIWGSSLWIGSSLVVFYLSDIATGIGLLVYAARSGTQFGEHRVESFGTAFWSISVSLNVLATTLIAGRLLYHRRTIRMVSPERNDYYISVISIVAESAAVYSISGLIYIPLFARNLPLQYPFAALFCAASTIAPNLIILRMALGVAVTNQTLKTYSSYTATAGSTPSKRCLQARIATTTESHRDTATMASGVINTPAEGYYTTLGKANPQEGEIYALRTFKDADTVSSV